MNTIGIESVPQVWTEADQQFFRITASLFTSEFSYGAGVLLASYDQEADWQADGSPAVDTFGPVDARDESATHTVASLNN